MEPREIHYAGGQIIYNKEKVDNVVSNTKKELESKITAESTRSQAAEAALEVSIDKLQVELNKESHDRETGDENLHGLIGDVTKLKTANKFNTVSAINELIDKMDTYLQNQSKIVQMLDTFATRSELLQEIESRMQADRGLQENIAAEHIGCHEVLDRHEKEIKDNFKWDKETHQDNLERITKLNDFVEQLNKQGITVRDNLPLLTPAEDGAIIADGQIIIYIDTEHGNKIRFYQAAVNGGGVKWTEVYVQ